MAETPSKSAEEQPTQAESEAAAAAETVGVGAGAGGTDVLKQISGGNPGAFNEGAAKTG